jgi:hypothetical protein
MVLQKGEDGVMRIFNHIKKDRLSTIRSISSLPYQKVA